MILPKGATSITTYFKLIDPSDGTPELGLTVTNLDMSYVRDRASPVKDDATDLGSINAGYSAYGMYQVDVTNHPGLYRADWPNAAFIAGVDRVQLCISGAAIDPAYIEVELDPLSVGVPIALDGGAATIAAMLTKMADDNGGADFDAEIDSLNKIEASIVQGVPHAIAASAQNRTQGTIDSGSYASTALADGTKFQISPDGANGLDIDMTYAVGLTALASGVTIEGYWDGAGDFINIYAWNYLTTAWDQLSDSGTRMNNAGSDRDYGPFALLRDHQQDSDGEVKIRFTGDSVTSADDLYLDQVLVSALALGGLTLDDIANAVVSHDVTGHGDHKSLAHYVALLMISAYDVTTGDTATSFTCSGLPAIADYYNFHHVRIHDVTNGRFADSWISDMDGSGVVTLGRALPFTPDTASEMYVMNGLVAPSEIQAQIESGGSSLAGIKNKTDGMNFTGNDIKATLDSEEVTTDSTSRTASKADVSGLSTHNAAAVWTVGTRTLTSFGTLLADIWNRLTSALTTNGSIGKLIVTNLDAKISSVGGALVGAVTITEATIDVDSVALGAIQTDEGDAITGATVNFYADADTDLETVLYYGTTDGDGGYSVQVAAGATYRVKAVYTGYTSTTKRVTA